jgi:hypothetical protein
MSVLLRWNFAESWESEALQAFVNAVGKGKASVCSPKDRDWNIFAHRDASATLMGRTNALLRLTDPSTATITQLSSQIGYGWVTQVTASSIVYARFMLAHCTCFQAATWTI